MFVSYPEDTRDGSYTLYCFKSKSYFNASHVYFDDDFNLVTKTKAGYGWDWKAGMFTDPNLIRALEVCLPLTDHPTVVPPLSAAIAAGQALAARILPDSIKERSKRVSESSATSFTTTTGSLTMTTSSIRRRAPRTP